ncbi:MAG TPA: hypothetical protein VL053_03850 [Arachidicoccus sp.]|nr:hypothetical protein [Arachidicoccus sp.]
MKQILFGFVSALILLPPLLNASGHSLCAQSLDSSQKTNANQALQAEKYFTQMISLPPDSLRLDPFYKKYCNAVGIPVVASEKVPATALLTARDIICYMLAGRNDIRSELVKRGARVLVMAATEMETDLPERRDWKKPAFDDKRLTPGEREKYYKPGGIASMSDRGYWNQRARGMGGLITSCAEENLLGYPGTRYYGENILVHEFSHNMMGALRIVDTALYQRILAAYAQAKAKDMYKDQYAINTPAEYWAEGTQWWFWSNFPFDEPATGQQIWTPESLKTYDPTLYEILSEVYIGHHNPADFYYGHKL